MPPRGAGPAITPKMHNSQIISYWERQLILKIRKREEYVLKKEQLESRVDSPGVELDLLNSFVGELEIASWNAK